MNTMSNPRRHAAETRFRFFHRPALLVLALLALALTGCSMLKIPGSQPRAQVDSFQLTNRPTGPVTFEVLQAQVRRFADTYVATVAQACDETMSQATNTEMRTALLRWKLGQATSAYIDATGQNSAVNALDLLVLASMARIVVEGYGAETYGDAVQQLLETHRTLESNVWTLASGVLKPEQQLELHNLIAEWHAKNPHQHYIGPIRFSEFVTALGRTPTQASTSPTSIFSLLYLDPLAGLDPTAAAITETRELGERAMYYSQRMPQLLSWQVELLAYQLAGQPESQQILTDANRLAGSAEAITKTAQQVPQLVADSRATLDSVSGAATNLNAAIQSLTAFVQFVSPTNAAPTANTNGRPFNVLDYGTAAAQIGAAARDLNAALQTLNQSTPELARISGQTAADARQVVDHAFRCGIILILILLTGSVLAGLCYRLLVNKAQVRKSGSPSKG